MKSILTITVAILLAGLIGWAALDFTGLRHTFAGYSEEEQDEASRKFDTEIARAIGHPVNETAEQEHDRKVKFGSQAIETMYGKKSADRYRSCHPNVPASTLAVNGGAAIAIKKSAAEQSWCTKMDKQLGITSELPNVPTRP